MSHPRVVWSEGLFLQPQHFQQLERSIDARIEAHCRGTLAPAWGFHALELDASAARSGCVAIQVARGIMPDGTPFSIPDESPAPAALAVPEGCRNLLVHLCLPRARAGHAEYAFAEAASTRFIARVHRLADAAPVSDLGHDFDFDRGDESPVVPAVDPHVREAEPIDVLLAHPQLSLQPADAPAAGLARLPLTRILESRGAAGPLLQDPAHLPPLLDCRASPTLMGLLAEIRHLVRHRAGLLAERLNPAAAHAATAVGDVEALLMLQSVNRAEALLTHLAERESLHPEALYAALAPLAGELASFSEARGRRFRPLAPYRHADLQSCFDPLAADLRELLGDLLHPHAVALALTSHAPGLHSAAVPEPAHWQDARFILAVRADQPLETLRRAFPAQAKVGPPERIRDLVRLQLPAVALEPLPAAPPRLPFYAGHVYFELDRRSPLWPALAAARVIALHVAGDFPGLRIELWALRS